MHRRIASLLLAALIALPVAGPVSAVQPVPSPTSGPDGRPDTTGRYIVMLRSGADTAAVVEKIRKREGVHADRSYSKVLRGFAAKLDARQRKAVLADPNVLAVVPDDVIQLTQIVPTGVSRIGGRLSEVAAIDGIDGADGSGQRVDADVAIVDTGISMHPDLNVAGGYDCSTSDRSAWRDTNNHGTHVAGTVAALDNDIGGVGVAPGARVYGVKVLNDKGFGLVSWYVCGLDWIATQRDPNDASRPLFEVVNMSVTKSGSDDGNCGLTNNDPLHQAICRVVAAGITVVAAAGNDRHNAAANIPASYDEVMTVSAFADTDGMPGGLGGSGCYAWGGYDQDDTFADFSNYGSDVDIMAPGRCIYSTIPGPSYRYMSGTSMAAPTVTGAVALYKASRPYATPAEVREALLFLGNFEWDTSTDPDSTHEPLLDVSRIGPLGTFDIVPIGSTVPIVEGDSTATVPVEISRSPTFFERVDLAITSLPEGWTGSISSTSLLGWTAGSGTLVVHVARGTPAGRYMVQVSGTNQGRTMPAAIAIDVIEDLPTAQSPSAGVAYGLRLGITNIDVRVRWPVATDPSSAIAGYEIQMSRNGGAWGSTLARSAAGPREAVYTLDYGVPYAFQVRAQDAAGNWSPWATAGTRIVRVNDRSPSIVYGGTWTRRTVASATSSTLMGASRARASAKLTFSGQAIAVVAPRSRYRGLADIYIDGLLIKRITMRSLTSVARQVVLERSVTPGLHTIELRVVGSGTYPLVQLDAFIVVK